MMDMNGLVHSTAAKPSDAVPSLNFVKKFVDSCLGSEIEIEVLEALRERRIQKPTSEALQLLGHAIHDFGDQLPPLDVNRITLILLNIIRHPDIISSNASVPVQNAGCQSKILGLEMLRLTINALSQLVAQALVKISKENWLFMVKIMRELLETLTNGSELIIEWKYSRLYSGVLQCLQNVLTDFKGPIGDNISGMVTSLLNFLDYGWNSSHLVSLTSQRINEALSDTQGKNVRFTQAVYKPPHLRRGTVDKTSSQKIQNTKDGYNGKDVERRVLLSDSDQSDSDGAVGSQDKFKCSKIRALAVLNIQALARAEPKSLHAYWTLLFPTHDIMNRRRLQTSLLNTLLYDPILKAGSNGCCCNSISNARESLTGFHKDGRVQRCWKDRFLYDPVLLIGTSSCATPKRFSRLPEEMLPNIVEALQKRVKSLLSSINDQVNSLCMAINCIGCALNSAPPSVHVAHMLSKDSEIIQEGQLLQDLLVCTEAWVPTPVRVEALQVRIILCFFG
ncbi:hypothetical protein KP509_25G047800 [Ceratopteris richardii]|uniref:DUF4042 domain-containing protein n=1 Tax=Ceratopteris richardii TaxID=49495 RepID=A0A8T2RRD4_CERRI|nr:hypothetical protein KP509_25G047800 [Ceratopteris richardii]